MEADMFLAIYMIGMMIIFAGCAIWAGISDNEDKFVASCVVVSIALFWPLALPLAILYFSAKFLNERSANKDI